jgi:hypothetical protein
MGLRLTGEPGFFFRMALALTAIVVLGFGSQPLLGRVDYPGMAGSLLLHGLIFICWCALALAQPILIGRQRFALHRKLGWLAAALAIVMAVSGVHITMGGVAAGRLEPPSIWMAMNLLSVGGFLALVIGGVALRRATDWHRRLLACSTIILTGPAWARILPVHLFGPLTLIVLTVVVLAFVAWGMMHDRRSRGRIHPAWYWGALAVAAPGLFTIPLAMAPAFAGWAQSLVAG